MKLKIGVACVCVAALAQLGCTSKIVSPEEYSGFLQDYKPLTEEKSPSGAVVMRWIDPQVDVSRYASVLIEPSQLYPRPQPTEKIPQSTLQGITDYYDQALKRELSKVLPLAAEPGPGTLIVRPAITAISAKTEGLHAYEVIPIALLAAGVSAATGIRDQDTSIATEANFVDAASGQVVAQVVRKGAGKSLDNSAQVVKPSDAKDVIDGWAADMYRSFQQLRSK